jgi:hypothetical protein
MQAMQLSRAYLCVNCDAVGENGSTCVVCKSIALVNLEKLLNRTAQTYLDLTVKRLMETVERVTK